ncbi:ECF transporter S component [Clostridium mediterraneense]|uniref:ECF transporter S component n=1 Tax=Clostridium mediterraneense TaxID=1805472 RepID=UPI0008374279|nr:ECF transporter S component [Clostridium mediterraneense]
MNTTHTKSRIKTRKLVIISMLSGISIFLGLTGLGFITVPPVKATIMQIPVIIGAIIEGPIVGAVVGLIFGLFSIYQALAAPTITSFMFLNPIIALVPRILIGIVSYYIYIAAFKGSKKNIKITAIISSLIVSILLFATLSSFFNYAIASISAIILFTVLVFVATKLKYKQKEQALSIGIASILGTLTNTVGVLGLTYIIYLDRYAEALNISTSLAGTGLLAVGISNGIPESIVSALISIPVIIAVKKIRK